MKYDTSRPYAACFVILRRDNKVAFVLRNNTDWMNGYYGLPAGKVEVGESVIAATIREAKEETGIDLNAADLHHVLTLHRKADDETLSWIDVIFEADTWRGKVINAEPDRHSEIAWFDPDKLPDNVIPVLRYAFGQIKAGKTYAEYDWDKV